MLPNKQKAKMSFICKSSLSYLKNINKHDTNLKEKEIVVDLRKDNRKNNQKAYTWYQIIQVSNITQGYETF